MKFAIRTIMLAAAIIPAFAAAAQSSNGLTRAEVRAQITQAEQAGYNPARKDIHYPQSIQRAEARIQATASAPQADTSGYGPAYNAAGDSGGVIQSHAAAPRLYTHH
ncbi:DUF4148 domain-containing protein [Burkholderia sp. Bp9090]|uniref:DUF4148 domain-containing protein n=1 Tax=unclassified Burkholderia TaxID=2613784 RepID=UPI000F5998DA|nr:MULTISPECIES: DUF4148 domain-containing protein [unclassified Burkholderia]RQS46172.1 DUF4148 domain-containing protein [Burkholderia sp. Bp8990]RQZ41849.1 DUF4148 domain-containing protein [Burkholderia sp. Bp9090]